MPRKAQRQAEESIEVRDASAIEFDQASLFTKGFLCLQAKKNCLLSLALLVVIALEMTGLLLPASLKEAGTQAVLDLLQQFRHRRDGDFGNGTYPAPDRDGDATCG
jgi:hypothetical protein